MSYTQTSPPFEQYLHSSNLYYDRNKNKYVVNILLASSLERQMVLTNMNTHYEMKRFNVYRTFQLKYCLWIQWEYYSSIYHLTEVKKRWFLCINTTKLVMRDERNIFISFSQFGFNENDAMQITLHLHLSIYGSLKNNFTLLGILLQY